ncbi:MAG: DUF2384 domain-containing protein [Deltaproteobacteria bacterium]|nr:DUF2384 domain-containing protein [Deltaproteobacteria bacterium]
MEFSNVKQVLGLKEPIRSPYDLINLGGRGISKSAVARLARHLSIGLPEMAPLLSVTLRTIQRYSAEKVFSRAVSERVLRIALVVARGEKVFGGRERFNVWLKEPNAALKEKRPIELLGSDFGIDLILDELGRIEHGIVS